MTSKNRHSRQSRAFDTLTAMAGFTVSLVVTIASTLVLEGVIPGVSFDRLISQAIPGLSPILSPLVIIVLMTVFGLLLTAMTFIVGERRSQVREEKRAEATNKALAQVTQRATKAVEAAQIISTSTQRVGSRDSLPDSKTTIPERRFKVALLGESSVVNLAAARLSEQAMTEVVKVETLPNDNGTDLQDIVIAEQLLGYEPALTGTESLNDLKNVDVVIIAYEQHKGESLGQMVDIEKQIALAADFSAKAHSKTRHPILVLAMAGQELYASQILARTAMSRNHLVGTGGVYERACLEFIVARELNLQPHDVNIHLLGTVSGGLIPLWRYATVQNRPIVNTVSESKLREFTSLWEEQLSVSNRQNPLTQSATVFALTGVLLGTSQRVMTCSVYLRGEYDTPGIFAVAPTQLDINGVVQVVEVALTRDEQTAWQKSISTAQSRVNKVAGT